MSIRKPGRPAADEPRGEKLTKVSVLLDAEDVADLALLIEIEERALVRRPRGVAIRKAIKLAAAQARAGTKPHVVGSDPKISD